MYDTDHQTVTQQNDNESCTNSETLWNRKLVSNLAGVKRDPLANLIHKEASRGVENSLNGNWLKDIAAIYMSAYFASLWDAATSATVYASAAAPFTYHLAKERITVTSQHTRFAAVPWSVRPSGHLLFLYPR